MIRLLTLLIVVVACGPGGSSPATSGTPSAAGLRPLTVGLGYIPSVQFAPFYRAQRQGYYSAAGIAVTFQNAIDPNLITLVGQGAVDIGLADGTSVIPAVGQGIPIKYVGTVYARFPSVVLTPVGSGITNAAGLAGHTVGIPGRYGSSWIMLQALLASADLAVDDIEIREYPDFGQATGLQQGQVDAATGFANNEPVVLARAGFRTNVLTIDDITPLAGPGLITGETTLRDKGTFVRAFIDATLRAMADIEANPAAGLDDAIAVVPELASDREGQLAILEATIDMWNSEYTLEHGMGTINADAWTASLEFMRGLPDSNIPDDLTVDDLINQEFVE